VSDEHARAIQFVVDDINRAECEDVETWHKALLAASIEAILKGPDPVTARDFFIRNFLKEVR